MKRNTIIDILKGICIILIIVTHCTKGAALRLGLLFPYWVDMAVPIFMIISGYVYAVSYERHKVISLKTAYSYESIIDRIIRYTIPFFIAYLIELAVMIHTNGAESIIEWILTFCKGGYGPGSYYYPIMIQFIFLFPLLYFLIKKYDFSGLLMCGILNILYEILQNMYGVSKANYRLLVFRYILLISYGCYIYVRKSKPKKCLGVISFMIGILFIWRNQYHDFDPELLVGFETRTCWIAALYIIPIIGVVLSSHSMAKFKCKPLEILGQASYNIFLTQMVYYKYMADKVHLWIGELAVSILVSLIICIGCGILFYYIENRITKRILIMIKNRQYGKEFWHRCVIAVNKIFTQKEVQ